MSKRTRQKGESTNDVDVLVGQRLRELRMLAGLSQSDLAATIGLTFQQLQKYERGVNRISASKLYMLARHLNVPVSTFFVDLERPDDSRAVPASVGVGEASPGDAPIRSREALILARHFQRIRDPQAKAALKAFAEACAGMAFGGQSDQADQMVAGVGGDVERVDRPRLGDGSIETRAEPRRRRRVSRRPRGAIWHPTDIGRT